LKGITHEKKPLFLLLLMCVRTVVLGGIPETRRRRGAAPFCLREWYPLWIGTLVDDVNHTIDFHTTIDTPRSFEFVRGSTNGVAYKNEIWFMVHGAGGIHYSFYHKVVVLDAETLQVKRHSYPFVLEGCPY
jgi:hypothetical protein